MLSQAGSDALSNVKVIEQKVFTMLMMEEKRKVMEYSGGKVTPRKPDPVLLLSITKPTSTNQALNPCPIGKFYELVIRQTCFKMFRCHT